MIEWDVLRPLRAGVQPSDMAAIRCIILLWLPAVALVLVTINFSIDVIARDFSNFWLAGHAADKPYGLLAYMAHQRGWPDGLYNFTYPPPAIFLTRILAVLPLRSAFLVWNAAGMLLFYLAARPYCPKGFPTILAIITPAAILNDNFGQMGLLIGALWLFAWRGSNFCAAALIIKPHMGFLVLLKLVRDRRIAGAIGWGIALIIVPTIAFGLSIWPDFFRHILSFQGEYVANSSFKVWIFQSTTPYLGYGLFGWLCYAVAGSLLLARNCNVWTAATATFLISPYGFHYDMSVVCLGLGILAYELWNELAWYEKCLIILAFSVPAIVHFGTWFASPLLLGGLWVQSRDRGSCEFFGPTKEVEVQ